MLVYTLNLVSNSSCGASNKLVGVISDQRSINLRKFIDSVGTFSSTYSDYSGILECHFEIVGVEIPKINKYYGNIRSMSDLIRSLTPAIISSINFENMNLKEVFPNRSNHIEEIKLITKELEQDIVDKCNMKKIKKLIK